MAAGADSFSHDANEGGTQVVDNILDLDGKSATASANMFKEAAASPAEAWRGAATDLTAGQHLSQMQLGGDAGAFSSAAPGDLGQGMQGMLDGIADIGTGLGGLFAKFFEFIMGMFSSIMDQMSTVLPQIELYEQAAVSALESGLRKAG